MNMLIKDNFEKYLEGITIEEVFNIADEIDPFINRFKHTCGERTLIALAFILGKKLMINE